MTFYEDVVQSRNRVEDARHDVDMALASIMVAIKDAQTVQEAHTIALTLHSIWLRVMAVERSAMDRQAELL